MLNNQCPLILNQHKQQIFNKETRSIPLKSSGDFLFYSIPHSVRLAQQKKGFDERHASIFREVHSCQLSNAHRLLTRDKLSVLLLISIHLVVQLIFFSQRKLTSFIPHRYHVHGWLLPFKHPFPCIEQ